MVVKTYRGLLADGGQDRIRLQTIKGKVGYRIVKFQVVGAAPGTDNYESVVQIWREEQAAAVATIDFTDSDLLGVGLWTSSADSANRPAVMVIIFDNILFSRNIYVTQQCLQGSSVNYYIELEEVPVSASALMQLKLGVARKLNLEQ